MKIAVCVKQVPDTETKIRLKADASGIDEAGVKWVMNPYDEFAVEEAIKLKDANAGSTIYVLSVGPKARVIESLRTALAMGADEGVLVDSNEALDPYIAAQALAKAIQKIGPVDIVFTGKLAIDDNASAVPQYLAEFLQMPHATVVSKFTASSGQYAVEREVEGGAREHIQLTGPCVIAANKGLNTPRYASLPGIMKAKKKPVQELLLTDLGITTKAKVRFVNYQLPAEKPPVKMLSGDAATQAQQLVKLLMDEAKVL